MEDQCTVTQKITTCDTLQLTINHRLHPKYNYMQQHTVYHSNTNSTALARCFHKFMSN